MRERGSAGLGFRAQRDREREVRVEGVGWGLGCRGVGRWVQRESDVVREGGGAREIERERRERKGGFKVQREKKERARGFMLQGGVPSWSSRAALLP